VRKIFLLAVGAAASFFTSAAGAAINVSFAIVITSVDGSGTVSLPLDFTYSATFDPRFFSVNDTGQRTYTNFVVGSAAAISSNVFSLLPSAAQSAVPYQIISGVENDYADVFITQIGFSDQRYYEAGEYLGQTFSEFSITNYGPSRGGAGYADQVLGQSDLLALLTPGTQSSFSIVDRIYDPGNTRTTYSGTATVTAVAIVPEAATWAMLVLGFGLAGGVCRHKKTRDRFGTDGQLHHAARPARVMTSGESFSISRDSSD